MKGNCLACHEGNVIFSSPPSQVEQDGQEVTFVAEGTCEECGTKHYVVAGGSLDLEE